MKRFIVLAFGILIAYTSYTQVGYDKYYVQFSDKDNSPYSINEPEAFLSQEAIERKAQHGIAIDERDLPVNPSYIQGVAATGVTILNPTKWFNGVTIYTTDQAAIDAINALPYVVSVLKNKKLMDKVIENFEKPFFKHETMSPVAIQKGTEDLEYGSAYGQINQLNGIALHNDGFTGAGMKIAVLDAGYMSVNTLPAFDSLWQNDRILGDWDFVDRAPVSYDKHTHGTAVLSTMGGNLPGELVGTAPDASYFLLRSEDGASETLIEEYNWVTAAEWADSAGADMINSSLGYSHFDDPSWNHTYEDMDGNTTPITIGADIAMEKGILVVTSAGNEGSSSWYYITAPADANYVLTVGAVNANGNYAYFSSRGPTYDDRIKPNIAATGEGAYYASPWGGVGSGNGTSFSSPIMAGMTACLWQAHPEMTNMEIIESLEQSGNQASAPDDKLGYGIPDIMVANDILTSLEDSNIANDEKLVIGPNPVTDELNIKYRSTDSSEAVIEIYSLNGQLMFSMEKYVRAGLNTIRVGDMSNISNGLYIVKVIADKTETSSKFLKVDSQ